MRRLVLVIVFVVVLCLIGWTTFQTGAAQSEPSMARLMPQGVVLFLEAKDFSGLLREWNASPEKQAWLKSDNHEVFSRSRLLLRLEQAQSEFAAAAGIPPDYRFLGEVAGQQSALAIYDIGKLEMLYITRLTSGESMKSALWQQRSKFEPRQAAGKQFFVRTEPESGRVVAFAIDGDHLILGTREDLVAGALSLLAEQKIASLDQQSWFAEAVKVGKEPGDLRMLIHLAEVTKTPQFRTYWVQQNITHMRQYESSISDLYRTASDYREERALLLKSAAESTPTATTDDALRVADLARLVPTGTGAFRCEAAPSVDDVLALIEQKVLTPRLGPAPPAKIAPTVTLGEGTVGSESSLETRIDVPPTSVTTGEKGDEALKALLTKASIRAALQFHRSEIAADGVFVRLQSGVVLAAAGDWNQQEVLNVLRRTLAPGITAADLGAGWKKSGAGAQNYFEMDGLNPVAVGVSGRYLVLANNSAMVSATLSRMGEKPSTEPAIYIAGFRHDAERSNFYKLTSLLDRANGNNYGGSDAEPQFFSQNIASLSRVFSGVNAQSIVIRRNGVVESQTVRYEWSR